MKLRVETFRLKEFRVEKSSGVDTRVEKPRVEMSSNLEHIRLG